MNTRTPHIIRHFSGTLTLHKGLLMFVFAVVLGLSAQGCKEQQTPVDNPTIIDNAPQFESPDTSRIEQPAEQRADSLNQEKQAVNKE